MTYHFEIKAGQRGSAKNHISYITRTGSHSSRDDLAATGHGNMPAWAENDPRLFWQAADKNERKNAAPFRSYTISLPNRLTTEQNIELSWELVRALAQEKPFQMAVHMPISSLEGQNNPHVHAVFSDRVPDGIERDPEQTFKRYNSGSPSRGGCRKDSGGRNRLELRDHVIGQRKLVADLINDALSTHGHAARVDHRTLKEQGVRRQPERYLGPARIRKMSAAEKQEYVTGRKSKLPAQGSR